MCRSSLGRSESICPTVSHAVGHDVRRESECPTVVICAMGHARDTPPGHPRRVTGPLCQTQAPCRMTSTTSPTPCAGPRRRDPDAPALVVPRGAEGPSGPDRVISWAELDARGGRRGGRPAARSGCRAVTAARAPGWPSPCPTCPSSRRLLRSAARRTGRRTDQSRLHAPRTAPAARRLGRLVDRRGAGRGRARWPSVRAELPDLRAPRTWWATAPAPGTAPFAELVAGGR